MFAFCPAYVNAELHVATNISMLLLVLLLVACNSEESTIGLYPENPGRHRIEHAQTLTAVDIPRISDMGIIAAMQPTHASSDMYWVEERLGPARVVFAYAWRTGIFKALISVCH